jgi:hypothetical protein
MMALLSTATDIDWYLAILAQCHLLHTLDSLSIDIPDKLWPAAIDNIDLLTPCRLEVKQVNFLCDGQHRLSLPIAWWLG